MKPTRASALTSAMVALTLVTGMVEAVSFLALGPAFTAVQTGNTLFLAFALGGADFMGLSVAAPLASLLGFTVGALLGARFESHEDVLGHRWLLTALYLEAVLLGIAGLVAQWGVERAGQPLTGRHYTAVALVALAMGLRNVTTIRAGVPDVSTTVVTRTLTALIGGSPLGHDTRIPSGARHEGRRAASIGAMFGGGLMGGWMLHEGVRPSVVLLVTAACVLAVAFAFSFASRGPAATSG
ncbi:YoaK family protein [Streptomyces sp. NPDC000410]|uniref:YoaK family protein n=1 Tax=Streptomyces sp. NPDC000410 TaxID=3154254 RepID=UPI0033282995